jgi:prepilin-type N-terminal cleavage/methylation domain-containing protein
MKTRNCQCGLTMVEVLLVVMILGLVAAIAIPAVGTLQAALRAAQVKSASDELMAALRHTRQRAISDARDHCIALRNVGGVAQYEIYTGTRSGTTCAGSSVEGPTDLSSRATISPSLAFAFTPVSSVSPVGPTIVVVTSNIEGVDCSVALTVTAEGGIQMPGTTC